MNRSTSSGRSSREELPDQVDRVREPLRDLDPHLAPLEHALDLGHELADQRLAPRRPRRRAGGERIGLREQVQRREPFGRLDPRGDVQDQVVVAEIASGGGVGQEQVLGHHEPSELARRRLDIHAGEDRGRDPVADQHVPALPVLADVVQERPEERAVPFLDVIGRHDLQRIVRVGLGEGAGHPVERPQAGARRPCIGGTGRAAGDSARRPIRGSVARADPCDRAPAVRPSPPLPRRGCAGTRLAPHRPTRARPVRR